MRRLGLKPKGLSQPQGTQLPVLLAAEAGGSEASPRRELLVSYAFAGAAIYLCVVSVAVRGATRASDGSPADVRTLVRNMAWNQVHHLRHPAHRYQYVDHEVQPSDSKATLNVETSQGVVSRVIRVNGGPPSAKQCRHDLTELAALAKNPRRRRAYFKDQKEDKSRRETLFKLMPKALLYRFDGVEKGSGLIRLKYKPNPAFSPHQTVGGVLNGLAGTLWVDPKDQRLTKIDGYLVKPVTIGWGILARINPGGRFMMEQTKLPDGTWRLSELNVRMHGSIMLLKRLDVNMKDTFDSYKQVASGTTVAEAVQMLERAPGCSNR